MMKAKLFTSFDEYEKWAETFDDASEYESIPSVIDDGFKVAIDLFVDCKSYKTALRRFEKAFKDIDGIDVWIDTMKESCANGYFSDAYRDNEYPDAYSWGVEETMSGYWYIYLNISGAYAGRDTAETETTPKTENTGNEIIQAAINDWQDLQAYARDAQAAATLCRSGAKKAAAAAQAADLAAAALAMDAVQTAAAVIMSASSRGTECLQRVWKQHAAAAATRDSATVHAVCAILDKAEKEDVTIAAAVQIAARALSDAAVHIRIAQKRDIYAAYAHMDSIDVAAVVIDEIKSAEKVIY